MGIRKVVVAVGIALGGALAVATGAGAANAVELAGPSPVGINATIRLDHSDTVALQNSGLVNALTVPMLGGLYKLDPASAIPDDPRFQRVAVTFRDVVAEAAARPNGSVDILLVDPAQWRGSDLAVEQFLN
ncbi:hypothetical protein D5S18_22800 [Nocardia panacis]|uniref:Uncharacterized protein n=1 Tax=Nocardia panacis TaxID=2340916 RepID=A0A3A4KFA4_9NOCA|nr:hypothetical protein [Nocardia panacis]RJO72016.1 hypothetical protein D5S18_22800 [Nocardia panacis]